MTFLKKLGQFLVQGIAVATGVWPLVSGFFGSGTKVAQTATTVINDLTQIGQVVVTMETALTATGSGADKLKAAIPLVANIVRTSEMVSGHKVANEALFTQACQEYVQATADLLNSLDSATVKSAGTPASSAVAQSIASSVAPEPAGP